MSVARARQVLDQDRCACPDWGARLWTLTCKGKPQCTLRELVRDALQKLSTVGANTAERP